MRKRGPVLGRVLRESALTGVGAVAYNSGVARWGRWKGPAVAQDRARDARVDDWDILDEAGAGAGPAAPGARPADASPPGVAGAAPAGLGAEPVERALSWGEVFRGTPLWVWLIGGSALFLLCAMFAIVMLIIGFTP